MAKPTNRISFNFKRPSRILKNKRLLKKYIASIFDKESRILESLDFIFCDDEELLTINRQFLAHDYYTDVLTFDLSDSVGIVGEIYISLDRIKENSQNLRTPLQNELHRVIFHGILHLCGFKDKTAAEKQIMRRKEDKYLKDYL